ncbi:MAG: sigma-54-dependent Fis family transcriptional regulator [Nitrospirae bacterium]|nr:sigma-54-dependent Fis family transcriptional regulator [Nitrospirota bacterium]
MKKSILIVDDDKNTREGMARTLSANYATYTATNGIEALSVLGKNEDIDMVLTDLMMPEMDGIELLEKIRPASNDIVVIMITGFSSIESAVDAMRKGAYDYITKPIDLNKLEITIKNALENKRLRAENTLLRQRFIERYDATTLVGRSKKLMEITGLINRVSSTKATVLIQGESGTGKELIANIIHYNSPAADGPFIKVNCSALTESLLESELFGHEKGAFTGAIATKKGRFELAHEGTLFMDEVGDMSLTVQVKLLRFLQEKTFERVGGTKTFNVDVRIIAATNKNLEELIKEGKFRDDLYYRLRVVRMEIPPIRERKEDIEELVQYFIGKYSEIHSKPIQGISTEAMELIKAYNWPGNVRELMNCIESAVVMATEEIITMESMPDYLTCKTAETDADSGTGVLYDIEKKTIIDILGKTGGNKVEASKMLGIGLRTLYRKMEKWGIQ